LAIGTACFSYRATVSLDQAIEPADNLSEANAPSVADALSAADALLVADALSAADALRAAAAVAVSVEALELVPDPHLDRIRRESQESEETDNIVVGVHRTPSDLEVWIEVRSVVQKGTGKFFVMIEDRQSPFASAQTRAIEVAVIAALQEEFPKSEIRFEDRVVGPSLGP
jgi:nucleotide-binding universal stress UspA family protein